MQHGAVGYGNVHETVDLNILAWCFSTALICLRHLTVSALELSRTAEVTDVSMRPLLNRTELRKSLGPPDPEPTAHRSPAHRLPSVRLKSVFEGTFPSTAIIHACTAPLTGSHTAAYVADRQQP